MQGAVHRDAIPDSVRLLDLGSRHVRDALPRLIGLIRREAPEVVLSTLSHLNLSLAALKWAFPRGTRLVGRETVVPSAYAATGLAQRAMFALYRIVHYGFDRLICQSGDMRADLVNRFHVPDGKCVVIPNPVDIDDIREKCRLGTQPPARIPGTVRLVAAGRLTHQKGFDLLLGALALIDRPNVHLCVMGEGPCRGALLAQAETLGLSDRVAFLGYQSNPYPHMANADAFVLSSRFEGMPNVVLEALVCGTPVVATPAPGGVREILEPFEQCEIALRVDAAALADALEKWLSGPRSRVPLEGIENYDAPRIARRYESVLLGMGCAGAIGISGWSSSSPGCRWEGPKLRCTVCFQACHRGSSRM
jgi:glycosyltransferase involved in cell wall biosynthesis